MHRISQKSKATQHPLLLNLISPVAHFSVKAVELRKTVVCSTEIVIKKRFTSFWRMLSCQNCLNSLEASVVSGA